MSHSAKHLFTLGLLALPLHVAQATERIETVTEHDRGEKIAVRVVDGQAMIDDIRIGEWTQVNTYGVPPWQAKLLRGELDENIRTRPLRRLWNGDGVPYEFGADYSEEGKKTFRKAAAVLFRQTGIRLTEEPQRRNRVLLTRHGSECSSELGMTGGIQRVAMTTSCMQSIPDTLHQIGHILGLGHEHQRSDTAIRFNVPAMGTMSATDLPRWYDNWTMIQGIGLLYDTYSVMHYWPREGRESRTPPFTTPSWLTTGTVARLAKLYPGAARRAALAQPVPPANGTIRFVALDRMHCLDSDPALARQAPLRAIGASPTMQRCTAAKPHQTWIYDDRQRIRSAARPDVCLSPRFGLYTIAMEPCRDDASGQQWNILAGRIVSVDFPGAGVAYNESFGIRLHNLGTGPNLPTSETGGFTGDFYLK
ncbi:M12 family metallopeptidase [Paludibacterium paludis]|nr:M12 family metallopeptidase [Paludibacterium paludis]